MIVSKMFKHELLGILKVVLRCPEHLARQLLGAPLSHDSNERATSGGRSKLSLQDRMNCLLSV